jgi:hypothetical protein
MKGLHRDEAVGGQDRGVKEDREGQEDQQCREYVARVSRARSENTLHQRETEIILITPDLGCARYQQRRDCRRICELLDGWKQMYRMRR